MPVVHINADKVAANVIAVGDPDRARLLAESLLDDAVLASDHRGLLLYNGSYNGTPVSIATHGMGGPSAAIVFEELAMLGARSIVRLGTAGSLVEELGIGDVVVAPGAGAACNGAGLSGYLSPGMACPPLSLDPGLTASIHQGLISSGHKTMMAPVVSSDSFYGEDEGFIDYWRRLGAVAVEMECATLAALSWMRGFRAACVLVVSNSLVSGSGEHKTTRDLAMVFTSVARTVLDAMVGPG